MFAGRKHEGSGEGAAKGQRQGVARGIQPGIGIGKRGGEVVARGRSERGLEPRPLGAFRGEFSEIFGECLGPAAGLCVEPFAFRHPCEAEGGADGELGASWLARPQVLEHPPGVVQIAGSGRKLGTSGEGGSVPLGRSERLERLENLSRPRVVAEEGQELGGPQADPEQPLGLESLVPRQCGSQQGSDRGSTIASEEGQ